MSKLVYEINDPSRPASLETSSLFDKSHRAPSLSAIDIFLEKTTELNKYLPIKSHGSGPLPNLILLGYVSAVESYFRDIIRRIILIDPASGEVCEMRTLTYGAAVSHAREQLPEALLENYSFASDENIKNAFKKLVGLGGNPPGDVKVALSQFSRVCQLRHCVAHRFGHLGSNNAIRLGLADHRECLEKPLRMDFGPLQEVALICLNAVRTSNSYLFHEIFERSVDNERWTWDLRKDRRRFEEFFAIFVNNNRKRTPKDAYNALRAHYRAKRQSRLSK